jgi:hypothetical protein
VNDGILKDPTDMANVFSNFFKAITETLNIQQIQKGDAVEITNTMHRFAPQLYTICWHLHISAVVCHLQGASRSV